MNINNQQQNSTEKKGSGLKVSAKRRTLVKGAVGAVPAVLTLRSGAAFALNSAEACVSRVQSDAAGTPPLVISTTNDGPYVRVPVNCRTLSNGDVVYQSTTVSGDWIAGNFASGGGVAPTIYVDAVDSGEMKEKGSDDTITFDIEGESECYVLAHFTNTGSKTGEIGDAVNDGSLPFLTDSCWASATPMP